MPRKFFFIVPFLLAALIMLLNIQGCIKEYSYEKPTVDTIPTQNPIDTTINKPIYTQCPLCEKNPDFILGKWSFSIDTFNFCGDISGAVMLETRTAFTFFGPSECSEDTGLVLTCYMNNPFSAEASGITVDRVTMRYYNRFGTEDMFEADGSLGFFLVIQNYSETTGIMKGFFSGDVSTDRNSLAHISNGKFEIQF